MLTFNLDTICRARGIKRKYVFLAKADLTYRVARRLPLAQAPRTCDLKIARFSKPAEVNNVNSG